MFELPDIHPSMKNSMRGPLTAKVLAGLVLIFEHENLLDQ